MARDSVSAQKANLRTANPYLEISPASRPNASTVLAKQILLNTMLKK
jgi:hypothetical protein